MKTTILKVCVHERRKKVCIEERRIISVNAFVKVYELYHRVVYPCYFLKLSLDSLTLLVVIRLRCDKD